MKFTIYPSQEPSLKDRELYRSKSVYAVQPPYSVNLTQSMLSVFLENPEYFRAKQIDYQVQ